MKLSPIINHGKNLINHLRDKLPVFLGKLRDEVGCALKWLSDRWMKTKMSIAGIWLRFKQFFLAKIWPVLKKIVVTILVLTYVTYVLFLTYLGFQDPLTQDFSNFFGVLVSTIGTIVAIFFSLILIPLNHIASRYSPKFLKFLRHDSFFLIAFCFSFLILAYDLIFLLIGSTTLIAWAASLLFLFELLIVGLSVRHVIKLSDPYYSILLPSHKQIVKEFSKAIPRFHKVCIKQTRDIYKKSGVSKDSLDVCRFQIDKRITNYIQENLIPIREVALKAIRDLDLEQARNAIQVMMSITVNYLVARKEYSSEDDPLLYFLFTEFKLIARAGSNELKLSLHPFLVDCWREIGIRAAAVNVKRQQRMANNLNGLVTYPIEGLKDILTLNISEVDSYAPGKACEALGDIGVQLMYEGYDHQASGLIETLAKISTAAQEDTAKVISGSANYAIMRIYATGVSNRNKGSYDPHNYPYREINKAINKLLIGFLGKERNVHDSALFYSFIGSLTDPFKGVNLSRISEYGLFSQEEITESSLLRNLECIQANIKTLGLIMAAFQLYKDWYFTNQAVECVYRIFYNTLAFLHPQIAKDHILFYKKHQILTRKIKVEAETVIQDAVKLLALNAGLKDKRHFLEEELLHTLFSMYAIVLYENKIRPNEELNDLFAGVHKQFKELLEEYRKHPENHSNDPLYRFYRLLKVVLEANNFKDLSADFVVPDFEYQYRGILASHESQYPDGMTLMMDHHWFIKRPGLQANANYYSPIEEALKLNSLTFH